MIEEMLIDLFKRQLGSQYIIYGGDNFERSFTKPTMINGQMVSQIQYDTFEKLGDKVIGVLQVQSAPYAVSENVAINTSYNLTLWVPANDKVISNEGQILKSPKFSVEKDLKTLRESLNNRTIELKDGFRCELTFSNAVSGGGSYDYSGAYKRKLLVITGKVTVINYGYFGRDYKMTLGWVETNEDGTVVKKIKVLNNLTSFVFNPSATPVENHAQGQIVPEEEIEAIKQACVFTIDDTIMDEDLNILFTRLALQGEASKQEFILSVSKTINGQEIAFANYPVFLSVVLTNQNGMSGIGTFSVSCVRSR